MSATSVRRPEVIVINRGCCCTNEASGICTEAISPGHVVERVRSTDGTTLYEATVKKNTRVTAGVPIPRMVAVHNKEQGKTIDDAYASGDRVSYEQLLPGAKVQLMLKAGETAVRENLLRVDNAGRVTVAGTNAVYALADEDLDLSGVGAVDTLIQATML